MAKLVVRSGRSAGEEYALNSDRMMMGRRSACPIPIADVKASREHAVVFRKDDDFFLQDLSRNGTLLNGHPGSKSEQGSPLKFGDRIKIGDTELELVDEKSEPVNIDIPGYQVLERIGAGGMGTVYKAKQQSMDRIVALKILNERYSANAEFVDRFIREARAAGQLNHPNVIHVHDISRANGRHYFSMEFVDGPSVKELLRLEKRIGVTRALDIVLQTAKALEFSHENKIIHRDVKPDNIMLTKEGIVKLADLGIAKSFDEKGPSPKEHRRVMGTPHYMAPEQALGKAIDHRVDIYSLGATFYHMVTGKTPFSGSTANEILKAHIQESLPPIQELTPDVPDPVCFIIERMMAKLPEKRYPDMAKVIADIERVQRGNVAGIDRIEAGESTIMRALQRKKEKEKEAAKGEKGEEKHEEESEAEKRKGDTAELPTGAQRRIPRIVLNMGLAAVFVAVVVGVVFVAKRFKPTPGTDTDTGTTPPDTTNVEPGEEGRTNPEAKKLLQSAIDAQKANDLAEYDRYLKAVRDRFSTSAEAVEAKRRLEEMSTATRDTERRAAENALTEAKAYETANPNDVAECIKKYTKAMEAGKNTQTVFDAARARIDALQKRLDDEQAKATAAAWRAAEDASNSAKIKNDYDAARSALQDFITKQPAAPQKADAEAALEKVDKEAAAKLTEVKEAVATMEIAPALAEWARYAGQVKDAKGANEIAAARQALEAKADQQVQDEVTKSSDKAKKYLYQDALNGLRTLTRRVAGLKKCEDALHAKEEAIRRQKDLHDKFLAAATKKLEGGPVPLPFNIETKFGDVKWKVARVTLDQVTLDSMSPEKAPGLPRRLADFKPDEQYKLYLLFLPPLKEMSADDHKSLAAFCLERGLAAQAEMHTQKAEGGAPAPP
ncbi:MAG: protein kinase [Planctomycetota bacterium]|nr:protein kinase [Planctomycetota bacterium]